MGNILNNTLQDAEMGNPEKWEASGPHVTFLQRDVINADPANRAIDGNDAV